MGKKNGLSPELEEKGRKVLENLNESAKFYFAVGDQHRYNAVHSDINGVLDITNPNPTGDR